jgi:hypothetical protein
MSVHATVWVLSVLIVTVNDAGDPGLPLDGVSPPVRVQFEELSVTAAPGPPVMLTDTSKDVPLEALDGAVIVILHDCALTPVVG